jgi:hypothetical protein
MQVGRQAGMQAGMLPANAAVANVKADLAKQV